jgi:tetratricopeptide (TPR) repeat protein
MSNQEIISSYFAGDLDFLGKIEVEHRMEADKAFAREFEETRDMILMAKAMERAKLKTELLEEFGSNRPSLATVRPLYAAGAVIAAAASLLLFFFLTNPSPQDHLPEIQQQALTLLQPYPLPAQRGAEPLGELRTKAYTAYRKADYEEAIVSFEALREHDTTVEIFYADCLSQTGKYTEAISILRRLAQDSPYADAAEWRLALNLILTEKTEEAKSILNRIAHANHYKAKEARKLLEE